MKNLIMILSLAIFAGACATYPDVRPGSRGYHKVVVKAESRGDGVRDALRQARNYCDEDEKRPVVLKEQAKYIGPGKEKDYRRNKRLAKAGKVLGTGVGIFGGKRERVGGAAFGVGSAAGDAYLGEQYRVYLEFRCRS